LLQTRFAPVSPTIKSLGAKFFLRAKAGG